MSELVIMHKQLGDTIMLEPVLRKLAAETDEPVQLLCPPQFKPLIELMPHTRYAKGIKRFNPTRLWAYDGGSRTTRSSLLTVCRKKNLLLPNANLVGCSHRLTYSDIHIEPYLDRYIAHYFWEHTGKPVAVPFVRPRLELPPDVWAPSGFEGTDYVVLNPVAAWKRKCYPIESWLQILSQLTEETGASIVLTGGVEDWQIEWCRELEEQFSGDLLNLAGQTRMNAFMFVVSRARMVLSVDGAAAHLAAAFGRKVITLFGPSYESLWHYPEPCHLAFNAATFTSEKRPAASLIPPRLVAQSAVKLWNSPADE